MVAQKAESMETRTQALEDHYSDVADNIDKEEIDFEVEKLDFECGQAQKREDPTQESVTGVEVQDLISKEVKKSRGRINAPVLTELREKMLIDAINVGYKAAKVGVKNCFLNLVAEIVVDITQKGKYEICC